MAKCYYLINLRNHKRSLFSLRRDSDSQVPSPFQTEVFAGDYVGFVTIKRICHVFDTTRRTHGVWGWKSGDYVMVLGNANVHDGMYYIDVGNNYPAVSKYLRATGWEVMR